MCCAFKEVVQDKQGYDDVLCTTVDFNVFRFRFMYDIYI